MINRNQNDYEKNKGNLWYDYNNRSQIKPSTHRESIIPLTNDSRQVLPLTNTGDRVIPLTNNSREVVPVKYDRNEISPLINDSRDVLPLSHKNHPWYMGKPWEHQEYPQILPKTPITPKNIEYVQHIENFRRNQMNTTHNVTIENDKLIFNFPEHNSRLEITFHKTLRLPEDNKTYPLPPSLGSFPLRAIDSLKNIPALWRERGGVCIPMWQSEALWISFSSIGCPFAVSICSGKVNVLNGEKWDEDLSKNSYIEVPGQPWIDGFCVKEGRIKQFVAAIMGQGQTVEEQLNKTETGGLQFLVRPLDQVLWEKEQQEEKNRMRHVTRGMGMGMASSKSYMAQNSIQTDYMVAAACAAPASIGANVNMGLGMGGSMHQEIMKPKRSIHDWSSIYLRSFVHLANAELWSNISDNACPSRPISVSDYNRYQYPWFSWYGNGETQTGSDVLANLKTVGQVKENSKIVRQDKF